MKFKFKLFLAVFLMPHFGFGMEEGNGNNLPNFEFAELYENNRPSALGGATQAFKDFFTSLLWTPVAPAAPRCPSRMESYASCRAI